MKKQLSIKTIALAFGFALSTGLMAQGLSKDEFKTAHDAIASEYKSAKAECAKLSGNPNDICIATAKGKEKISNAELDARMKPSRNADYEIRMAKSDAAYAVAAERCDDLAGNAKDVCVKEAKAVRTTSEADAKAQLKTSGANATANEKTADAREKASDKATDARKDATADKMDAEYSVAKEKCDTFSGSAKDQCISQAKSRFGKS